MTRIVTEKNRFIGYCRGFLGLAVAIGPRQKKGFQSLLDNRLVKTHFLSGPLNRIRLGLLVREILYVSQKKPPKIEGFFGFGYCRELLLRRGIHLGFFIVQAQLVTQRDVVITRA